MIQLPLERNEALLLRALLESTETSLRGYTHGAWTNVPVADELNNVRTRLEQMMLNHDLDAAAQFAQAAAR